MTSRKAWSDNPESVRAHRLGCQFAAKKRKYGNKHVIVGSQHFDSMREAKRWLDLEGRQRRGEISSLERQVTFVLAPSVRIAGEKRARPALRFKVDFRYVENGQTVVEDAKGFADTAFRIRQHLMKSVHGIDVRLS
jgi:hypothetical protein